MTLLFLSLLSCSAPCTTSTPEGTCSVVEQCGCGSCESCTMALSTATCDGREACHGWTAGELGVGDVCSLGNWDADLVVHCLPGSICWNEAPEAETGRCHEWCRDDGDCSVGGARCEVEVTRSFGLQPYCPTEPVVAPYRLCAQE